MKKLIYFSTRLTDKLNAIHKYPITIVSGRPGIGKSFAVQTYLLNGKAEVIWHASKAIDFVSYLREFQRNYAVMDSAMRTVEQEQFSKPADPSGAAVELAIAMKQRGMGSRLVYVLEYQGYEVPEDILDFLHSLSNQRVSGLNIVLIARQAPLPTVMERMSASANMIPESTFLLTAGEIRQAFARNGVTIGDAEAAYLYLRSAGWICEVSRLYQVMLEKGKAALYEAPNRDAFLWDASEEWKERFLVEPEMWNMSAFDEVRRTVEAMDLDEAFIAVERLRMKSERFSAAWDVCDYYSAVLQALSGRLKTALEDLNQEFELRIQHSLCQSAHRINLAQVQLRILLGENWFDDERELLVSFANRRIYENQGISKNAAGLALWHAKEYRKLIAFLSETDEEDEIDTGYREFLLSMAYYEIGFEEEASRHLDAAWGATAEDSCLSAILFFDAVAKIDRGRKNREDTARHGMSPEFRAKLAAWRRAMRRNNAGTMRGARQALTVRESEIVECVARKMRNKEIASYLNISENTVKTTLKHIFRKLEVSSRRELQ